MLTLTISSCVAMHAMVTLRSTTGVMISTMARSTATGTMRFSCSLSAIRPRLPLIWTLACRLANRPCSGRAMGPAGRKNAWVGQLAVTVTDKVGEQDGPKASSDKIWLSLKAKAASVSAQKIHAEECGNRLANKPCFMLQAACHNLAANCRRLSSKAKLQVAGLSCYAEHCALDFSDPKPFCMHRRLWCSACSRLSNQGRT